MAEGARDCRKLLVVDDDDGIRESIRDLLEDEGYRVETATNGREALAAVSRHRPCVMLLDLMMPVMNGWQVLDALRSDQALSGIPVVVVSAAADGLPSGVARTLRKPLRLEALLDAVKAHCG